MPSLDGQSLGLTQNCPDVESRTKLTLLCCLFRRGIRTWWHPLGTSAYRSYGQWLGTLHMSFLSFFVIPCRCGSHLIIRGRKNLPRSIRPRNHGGSMSGIYQGLYSPTLYSIQPSTTLNDLYFARTVIVALSIEVPHAVAAWQSSPRAVFLPSFRRSELGLRAILSTRASRSSKSFR